MAFLSEELTYPSADGKSEVFARVWQDDTVRPAFILQICHGVCEYIDRYAEFAEYICTHGGVVCGNDHLGHGRTKEQNADGVYGYFAEKDGEKLIVVRRLFPDEAGGRALAGASGRADGAQHGKHGGAELYGKARGRACVCRFHGYVGSK